MEKNISYNEGRVSPADRQRTMGQRGCVLWFTGLSGSGKSTIATGAEGALTDLGYKAYLIDGDNLRHTLNSDLGFSEADRAENIRRLAVVADTLADAGMIVLVAAITPLEAMRENARKIISQKHIFRGIYVRAGIKTCSARDPKGLYKKAAAGEITGFTGIDAPFEEPASPDLILDTETSDAASCVGEVVKTAVALQLDYRRLADDLIALSREACKAILEVYSRPDLGVEYKSDTSPVTDADRASDEIIREGLRRLYPQFSVLTEESADDSTRLRERWCFIVDPLDGTKEFVRRSGEFTVNIALAFDGSPVAGVIAVPCGGDVYYAAPGIGARRIRGGRDEPISVSTRTSGLVVIQSRSHVDPRELELTRRAGDRIARTISAGSSLKGCRVAEGEADVYYRFGFTCEWDTAAMQCICEAAGAVVRQCDDSKLTYNRPDTLNEKGFYIISREENRLHELYEFKADKIHK